MSTTPAKLLLPQEVTDKILRTMQDGLVVIDSEDNIQIMNEAARRIFGISPDAEVLGQHVQELFTQSQESFSFLFLLEKEKHLHQYETSFVRANGENIICSLSASIIADTVSGDLLKVIIFQDITERKRAAERLEKSNRDLDQFAYIVSHDLKAPLRAINNLAQWIYEDVGPVIADDSRKNLEMLRGRVLRMDALITGILEYSKIGRTKTSSGLVDVSALLGEVLDLLAPPKHIGVVVETDMPVLNTSKIMLLQVFSNLISNAIKYNDKPAGLITIRCAELHAHYEFRVEDNGPGIPAEYQEKVFVIFQTLQSRDKKESTGIGLTIVKRIVEEHGGKIWIESKEGNGSKFVFTWPKILISPQQ